MWPLLRDLDSFKQRNSSRRNWVSTISCSPLCWRRIFITILELNKQCAQLHSAVANDSDTNKHVHVSKLLGWCRPSVRKIWQSNLSGQQNCALIFFFLKPKHELWPSVATNLPSLRELTKLWAGGYSDSLTKNSPRCFDTNWTATSSRHFSDGKQVAQRHVLLFPCCFFTLVLC